MTSKQSKLLLGVLSAAAVVVGILLFSSMGKKKKLTYRITGVEPVEQNEAAPTRPPSAPKAAPTPRAEKPASGGGEAVQPPSAATGADAGSVDASSTIKRPTTPAELKKKARDKQLQMYRTQLSTLKKRRARLLDTIARLKREGASKEAMESMQTRLQQLIEAEPRLKAHLEKLEAAQK